MQDFLGVDEPNYGHLYQSMVFPEGVIFKSLILQPKIEAVFET